MGDGSERKGRPQQGFCYRTGEETGGLDLGEKKKRCGSSASLLVALSGSSVSLLVALTGEPLGLAGGVFWDWGLRQSTM